MNTITTRRVKTASTSRSVTTGDLSCTGFVVGSAANRAPSEYWWRPKVKAAYTANVGDLAFESDTSERSLDELADYYGRVMRLLRDAPEEDTDIPSSDW